MSIATPTGCIVTIVTIATARILEKFQTTVPPQVRELYDLKPGDLLEYQFDQERNQLVVIPKRAQLLTAELDALVVEEQELAAQGRSRAPK